MILYKVEVDEEEKKVILNDSVFLFIDTLNEETVSVDYDSTIMTKQEVEELVNVFFTELLDTIVDTKE